MTTDPTTVPTFTLADDVTEQQAIAILTDELVAECVHNTEAGDAHTLGDYMADVQTRFQRMLQGVYGQQEFGDTTPLTFSTPERVPDEMERVLLAVQSDHEAEILDVLRSRAGITWECYGPVDDPDKWGSHYTNHESEDECGYCGAPRRVGSVPPSERETAA